MYQLFKTSKLTNEKELIYSSIFLDVITYAITELCDFYNLDYPKDINKFHSPVCYTENENYILELFYHD